MTNRKGSQPAASESGETECPRKPLSEAARRALAEADVRRTVRDNNAAKNALPPKEIDGVDGPDPVRYGDWENKGRASDF